MSHFDVYIKKHRHLAVFSIHENIDSTRLSSPCNFLDVQKKHFLKVDWTLQTFIFLNQNPSALEELYH